VDARFAAGAVVDRLVSIYEELAGAEDQPDA
jgi:hypothetical protein